MKHFFQNTAAKVKRIPYLSVAVLSAAVAFLLCLAGQLLLRNFYRFLEFDPTFYRIFEQISTPQTRFAAPALSLFFLTFLIAIGLKALWKKGLAGHIFTVFLGVAAVCLLLLLSVLLTRVNRVMFLDVVRSLLPLLSKGVL